MKCAAVNEDGWCEECNGWDVYELIPHLYRCPDCENLSEVGLECWCKSKRLDLDARLEKLKRVCKRCRQETILEVCPDCGCKELIERSDLEIDALKWASSINQYDHKQPKSGLPSMVTLNTPEELEELHAKWREEANR